LIFMASAWLPEFHDLLHHLTCLLRRVGARAQAFVMPAQIR
jgi:hypothetical protein